MAWSNEAQGPDRGDPVRVAVALRSDDGDLLAMLGRHGMTPVPCRPAQLEQTASEGSIAAVVIDGGIDGALAAVARLRRQQGLVATLPVVLLGEAREGARDEALQAGVDSFHARPVAPDEVVANLQALLDQARSSGPPLPPGVAAEGTLEAVAPASHPPAHRLDATGLSAPLAGILHKALVNAGCDDPDLDFPVVGDESVDDLIPPELLEPLDLPLDALTEDLPGAQPEQTAPDPSTGVRKTSVPRGPQPSSTITPLDVGGDLRMSGALGALAAGQLLGAASRARATGTLVLRAAGMEWLLSLSAGHLQALRSSRPEDQIGPLLVRLGFVPREAARFAAVPLDTGPRGAALLAARGYLAPDGLAAALSQATQEVLFDLLRLEALDWEIRALESVAVVPLSPRSLDALLVLATRARIEPAEALSLLGGDEARLTLRADPGVLQPLQLQASEGAAATGARNVPLAVVRKAHGDGVLPVLLALHWIGHLRVEGASPGAAAGHAGPLGPERTRLRALVTAAEQQDYLALLGVSEWATRLAAQRALDARRVELDSLRARYPGADVLPTLFAALDELGGLLSDVGAWERYVGALRAAYLRPAT